jgi:hypothetical protein
MEGCRSALVAELNMALFIAIAAVCIGLTLAFIYNTRYRSLPWDIYYPKLAWMRAGMYFSFCYTLSYLTGGMELILSSPVFTAEQLANPNWVFFTAGVTIFIVVAYAGVWSYFTPVFRRKKNILVSAAFGFLWGSSSGQLFLSVWLLSNHLPLPAWGSAVTAFLILAAWQPNWHNIYWDHYIAPEHDTPMTQVIKASCCHIPNLTIALIYLTLYENYLIFVLAQVVACTSAGIGMRYPAPWSEPSRLNYAVRTAARIPRCTGYIPESPKSDPYTPFYPGWKGSR